MKVIIKKNLFDTSKDACHEVDDVYEFLYKRFTAWPKTAKIYNGVVSEETELSLKTEDDLKALANYDCICVVLYPAGMAVAGIALVGATVALSLSNKSKKNASNNLNDNSVTNSPANTLSPRNNKSRLGSRVADIYGTCRAVPDLLSEPFIFYNDNKPVEYALYCVGRGEYDISDVKDGDTPAGQIANSGIEFYPPGQSPLTGTPQLVVGGNIVLNPYGSRTVKLVGNVVVQYFSLVGPFKFTKNADDEILINLQSQNVETGNSVTCTIQVGELDANDNPTGVNVEVDLYLFSTENGVQAAHSEKINVNYTNVQVIVYRTNLEPYVKDEEVLLESIKVLIPVTGIDFSDITSVYSATSASEDTAAIGNRQLNCLAARKVKNVNSNGTIGATTTSNKFIDILADISLDSRIGNRTEAELDLESWYSVSQEISTYFGHSKATEFSYIFDDQNTSYEEMVSLICESCFCNAYRLGNLIKLFFEKETNASTLLLNHRNKVPNTESRNVKFGILDDNDGVELEWVDRDTGEPRTYHLPTNQSATNPERIKIGGVQNGLQAYFHAHRLWNRLQHQNTFVECDALQETNLLKLNERILIADNTRIDTLDGEIVIQSGVNLTLSQKVDLSTGGPYTIFLQDATGKIESRIVTQGSTPYEVIIDSDSSLVLSTDDTNYARSTFEIVANSSNRKRAFLIDEIDPSDNFVNKIVAVNYDSRYYDNDTDYIDLIVDENGE